MPKIEYILRNGFSFLKQEARDIEIDDPISFVQIEHHTVTQEPAIEIKINNSMIVTYQIKF